MPSLSANASHFRSSSKVSHGSHAHSQADKANKFIAPHQDFAALCREIAHLLTRTGYREVRLVRRHFRGHNAEGGYDLTARTVKTVKTTTRSGAGKVIVQIKQYSTPLPIYQRQIDELAGVALRTGAVEALLFTTSTFSPSVQSGEFPAGITLRLIDGHELNRLLSTKTKEATEKDTEMESHSYKPDGGHRLTKLGKWSRTGSLNKKTPPARTSGFVGGSSQGNQSSQSSGCGFGKTPLMPPMLSSPKRVPEHEYSQETIRVCVFVSLSSNPPRDKKGAS